MWRYVWNLRWVCMPASMSLTTPSPSTLSTPTSSHSFLSLPLALLERHCSPCELNFLLVLSRNGLLMEGRSFFSRMTAHGLFACLACTVCLFLHILLHVGGSGLWLILRHAPERVVLSHFINTQIVVPYHDYRNCSLFFFLKKFLTFYRDQV